MANLKKGIESERIISDLIRERFLPRLVEKTGLDSLGKYDRINNLQKFNFQETDIFLFSKLLVENDIKGAQAIVEQHISSGCSAPLLVLGLLSRAARHLGEQWCRDESSFADVTIGMAALHHVLRSLDKHLVRDLVASDEGHSILLVTMPGDTHIFGVSVLEAFFRNSGWKAEAEFEATTESLVDRLSKERFDVVGISVAHSESVSACKALIKMIREHSLNREVKVMAGGASFLKNNRLRDAVGADATAEGALDALQLASEICVCGELDKAKVDNV